MQLEPAIRNDLVELIAANFKTDEVNELGRLVLGSFDSNKAAGIRNHVSLSARKSAGLLVDKCTTGSAVASLVKLVIEVDDGVVRGRPVRVEGLGEFLGALPPRAASIFRFGGIFEEEDLVRTTLRLDSLLCEEPPDSEVRFA